jgi:hypothetical protein
VHRWQAEGERELDGLSAEARLALELTVPATEPRRSQTGTCRRTP